MSMPYEEGQAPAPKPSILNNKPVLYGGVGLFMLLFVGFLYIKSKTSAATTAATATPATTATTNTTDPAYTATQLSTDNSTNWQPRPYNQAATVTAPSGVTGVAQIQTGQG